MSTFQEKSRRFKSKTPISDSDSGHSFSSNQQGTWDSDFTTNIIHNSFVNTEKSHSVDSASSSVVNENITGIPEHPQEDCSDIVTEEHRDLSERIRTSRTSLGHQNPNKLIQKSSKRSEKALQSEKKIDIEEHLVENDQFALTRVKNKAFFRDFIKSLNVLCDICDDATAQRVIKLNYQERFAAAVVAKKSLILGLRPKTVLSRRFPEKSCRRCFTAIIFFRNRLKIKFPERIGKKEATMGSHDPHGCKCPCISCESRYGQLGLIVTGIESLSSNTAIQTMLDSRPQTEVSPQAQDIGNLDRPRELENIQETRDFHMHEMQPIGQQMYHHLSEAIRPEENIMFPRQPHFEQSFQTTSHMPHFHNISNDSGGDTSQSSSCLGASSITLPFLQQSYGQDSFQTYGSFTSSASQPLIESHPGRSRMDPNIQPPPTTSYHGQTAVETYSEYSTPHSSIGERSRLDPNQPTSQSSTYRDNQEQQHQEAYTYPGSINQRTHTTIDISSSREHNFPVTIHLFEKKHRIDPSQPSTSRGFTGDNLPEEEHSPRKTKKICVHCQKQFTHTGDFRKHLRKHTKEKPYACKQCDKRFSHTSNLHRHERSHTGDRPYTCEFCNKQFNRKDKLDSHKNSKSCKNKRKDGWK